MTHDGFSAGEGGAADGGEAAAVPPLNAVACLNAAAKVVTPWQALSDEEILAWDGDLMDYYAANHERHYGDPRKRPRNPWQVEGATLEGHRMVAVCYGSQAGWLECGAMVWEHGLQQFQMGVYSRYDRREPTDLVLGVLWELGGVQGLMGTLDPVGDTYALDDRLFPEAWWMLRPMKAVLDREPRLLQVLADSEGGRWLKAMMGEVGERLAAGEPVPTGWSYAY